MILLSIIYITYYTRFPRALSADFTGVFYAFSADFTGVFYAFSADFTGVFYAFLFYKDTINLLSIK